MTTIYYPHLDLENRGLLKVATDHILNIKLLTLMADHVLILSSHLLDTKSIYLYVIKNCLSDFIADGKIKTVLYNGYSALGDYLYSKVESTTNPILRVEYKEKANYINDQIFNCKDQLVYVDNEKEREQFHSIYVDTNVDKARKVGNRWLIHSALKFREEIYKRRDQKDQYLTLPEVNQAIIDLVKSGQIKETHYPFFINNQIGAYYFCGSQANSAITAFNPYFEDIQFDKISHQTSYHSTRAYDPDFFMNVLISLDVINGPEDIKSLSSREVDLVRSHRAWSGFQALFSALYDEAFIFNEFIRRERDVQKKAEWIKEFLFCVPAGVFSDFLLSPLITSLPSRILGIAISKMLDYIVSCSRTVRLVRERTIDRMIESIIASKEPLYVITSRLKRVVEKIAQ